MFRFIAPAGAPIRISQIFRSAVGTLIHSGMQDDILQTLAGTLNARHVFAVSSGRAALSIILKALLRLRPEGTVAILPAYTCFTVPAAIVRAGLKLHPVEINPCTLDFDPEGLAGLHQEKALCLITSNLFGMGHNMQRIRDAGHKLGTFLVDDAAQALGSTWNGEGAGLLGDVGFYSFGRGKALAAIEGGLIVTNSDEIAAAIRQEEETLPGGSPSHNIGLLLQLLVYALFLKPRLYWIPNSMPFLKLGSTEFDPQFPMFRLPALLRNLLPKLMERLGEFNRIRRANAAALASELGGIPSFAALRPVEGSSPNYIRFPLLAGDQARRDRAIASLRAAGIGASPFYPGAICDIEGIAPHMAIRDFHRPKAEEVSRRLLTLPTHPYITDRDKQVIINTLRRVAAE